MNIILIYQDMPYHVRALTHMNADGSYTIIVNSHCSWEMQKAAVLHELTHIKGNDFSAEIQADLLEKMLHNQDLDTEIDDFQFFVAG